MTISNAGIILLKKMEGFRSEAYRDVACIPTIGYGTTVFPSGRKVSLCSAPISEEQAASFLTHDLIKFENSVNRAVKVHIDQSQYDALVIFCYNVGVSAFEKSTLLKRINEGEHNNVNSITEAFLMWTKISVGGKKIESRGLVNRRKKEIELYFT